jgi:hypothetical protein
MANIASKNLTDRMATLLDQQPNVARDLKRIEDGGDTAEEGGITEVSLANAVYLLARHGLPHIVRLANPGRQASPMNHTVRLEWNTAGMGTFLLDGFGWGYHGAGSMGLARLLILLGIRDDDLFVVRSEIGRWPQEASGAVWRLDAKGWTQSGWDDF